MVEFSRFAVHAFGRRVRSLVGAVAAERSMDPSPGPNQLSTAIHNGCMGLPQELVDYTMDILRDDLLSLKACSLTCRAMFVSTRHLIHQTLFLARDSKRAPGQGGRSRSRRRGRQAAGFPRLSHMGEHGLLRYTRHVHIHTPHPEDIQGHHLHHFRSINRAHTLTIERYYVDMWAGHYQVCFAHFYPTLTSLTLNSPFGDCGLVLQFVLQFPNLENLCLEWLGNAQWLGPGFTTPGIIDHSPPLCGRLRLVGYCAADLWMTYLTSQLRNGIRFRSVELQAVSGEEAQHILNVCAGTLENLSIVLNDLIGDPHPLTFAGIMALRRLDLRMAYPQTLFFDRALLCNALSTITSPVFCEFVIELRRLPEDFEENLRGGLGQWEAIDACLEEQFVGRGRFKVTIRAGRLCDQEDFREGVKRNFPFSTKRGWVHFEASHSR